MSLLLSLNVSHQCVPSISVLQFLLISNLLLSTSVSWIPCQWEAHAQYSRHKQTNHLQGRSRPQPNPTGKYSTGISVYRAMSVLVSLLRINKALNIY